MLKRLWLLILVLAAACGRAAPGPVGTPARPSEPRLALTFMAGFKPQANLPFVGVYVAQEKGFFAQEGLDVTIKHSAGGGEHVTLLLAGEVQVTTQVAEDILRVRAEAGAPLVAIALVGQRGNRAWAVLEESGIATPKDWEGKRVGYKVLVPPDYLAILEAAGVDRSRIAEVPVGFDPRILLQGQVDVYQVFKSNEPYLLRKMGHEVRVFDAADYGVPTLGLTYATSEALLETHREALTRFLRAALRGIEHARSNPEDAVEITLRYAPEADREHMRFMLDTELEDALTPLTEGRGLGWQTLEQWQALAGELERYGAVEGELEPAAAFTTQLLP